jgi:hypothetical protein
LAEPQSRNLSPWQIQRGGTLDVTSFYTAGCLDPAAALRYLQARGCAVTKQVIVSSDAYGSCPDFDGKVAPQVDVLRASRFGDSVRRTPWGAAETGKLIGYGVSSPDTLLQYLRDLVLAEVRQ